jgi:hypothetical protein
MVRIRIDSDQPLKDTSIDKIKDILSNSKDIKDDLVQAFPKGFTSYNKAKFILTMGSGKRITIFIEVEGLQKETVDITDGTMIYAEDNEVDY